MFCSTFTQLASWRSLLSAVMALLSEFFKSKHRIGSSWLFTVCEVSRRFSCTFTRLWPPAEFLGRGGGGWGEGFLPVGGFDCWVAVSMCFMSSSSGAQRSSGAVIRKTSTLLSPKNDDWHSAVVHSTLPSGMLNANANAKTKRCQMRMSAWKYVK